MDRDNRNDRNGSGEPRTSHEFTGYVPVCAAQVWRALTERDTAGYLNGLTARSSWVVADPVTFWAGPDPSHRLHGVVLYVREPTRLSYSIQAAPGDPLVCLTWLLRDEQAGCVITLVVDDLECPDPRTDAERAWLPVLAALQSQLTVSPGGQLPT